MNIMNNFIIFLTTATADIVDTETSLKGLFSENFPATLTFITALLGILTQLIMSFITVYTTNKSERDKQLINSKRMFYLPLLRLLVEYDIFINILKQNKSFNLFDSNSIQSTNNDTYSKVCNIIKLLSDYDLSNYYIIDKKTSKIINKMLLHMKLYQEVLNMNSNDRLKFYKDLNLSEKGYDVKKIIKRLEKKIKY